MPEDFYKKDYIAFMQWFKTTHPDLYHKYGANITMAKDKEGVSIRGDNIPVSEFEMIMQIQYEYASKNK